MRPGEGFLRKKMKGVYDEHLIRREIYNPNDFDLIFERNQQRDVYVMRAQIPLGPKQAVCRAGSWLILPHGYYTVRASNGADIFNAVVNYGDQIGVGNKLPSLPVAETRGRSR